MLQNGVAAWELFSAAAQLLLTLTLILSVSLAAANFVLWAISAPPRVRIAARLGVLLGSVAGILQWSVAESLIGRPYPLGLQIAAAVIGLVCAYWLVDVLAAEAGKIFESESHHAALPSIIAGSADLKIAAHVDAMWRLKSWIASLPSIWRYHGVPFELPTPDASPMPSERYANAALFDTDKLLPLDPDAPLEGGQMLWLRADIGPLSEQSQVSDPKEFPDNLLPPHDLWLDVMLSSTDFLVGLGRGDLGKSTAANRQFMLPADGDYARDEFGERYLYFLLKSPWLGSRLTRFFLRPFFDAPLPAAVTARARLGYYYRNSVVQSQLVVARVGRGSDGYRITIDYTISTTLADVEAISDSPRVSIHTNDSGAGTHQIVVRGLPEDGPRGASVSVADEGIAEQVEKFRTELDHAAPSQLERSQKQLKDDLRWLAPIGRKLWGAVAQGNEVLDILQTAIQHPGDPGFEISRTRNTRFAFPWSFVYEIPLEDDAIKRNKLKFCRIVDQWDGKSPLCALDARRCPAAKNGWHDPNTLCPFGFWGYRYSVSQLTSTGSVLRRISVPDQATFVAGRADDVPKELPTHLATLEAMLINAFAAKQLSVGKTKTEIKDLLLQDLPMAYFYCHGQYPDADASETFLVVGKDEWISPNDFKGWLIDRRITKKQVIWDRVRPLIFINACHSVQIVPKTMLSFVDAFVSDAQAAGVIGTEVRVNPQLAMMFAERFFERLIADQWPVDRALHDARMMFLSHGNLLGLVYTLYCPADLRMAAAGAGSPAAPN